MTLRSNLKKLNNEKALLPAKNKVLCLKIPIGVSGRWVFEEAIKLRKSIKVRITLN